MKTKTIDKYKAALAARINLVNALADYMEFAAEDDTITSLVSEFLIQIENHGDCHDPKTIRRILPLQLEIIWQRDWRKRVESKKTKRKTKARPRP